MCCRYKGLNILFAIRQVHRFRNGKSQSSDRLSEVVPSGNLPHLQHPSRKEIEATLRYVSQSTGRPLCRQGCLLARSAAALKLARVRSHSELSG